MDGCPVREVLRGLFDAATVNSLTEKNKYTVSGTYQFWHLLRRAVASAFMVMGSRE
jgi:hypothetical protein